MQLRHWKIFTSVMLAICVALLVAWPTFVGVRPGAAAPLAENKAYAVKFVTYLGSIVLALILAAVGSVVVMRRTAAEYRQQQMENMKALIEATLLDQQRKNDVAAMD